MPALNWLPIPSRWVTQRTLVAQDLGPGHLVPAWPLWVRYLKTTLKTAPIKRPRTAGRRGGVFLDAPTSRPPHHAPCAVCGGRIYRCTVGRARGALDGGSGWPLLQKPAFIDHTSWRNGRK
jgi:hypothetical protein